MSQVTLSGSSADHPFVHPISATPYEKTKAKVVEIALLKIYIASLMSRDFSTSIAYLQHLGDKIGDNLFSEVMRDTMQVQYRPSREFMWDTRKKRVIDRASEAIRSFVESPIQFSETFREKINVILSDVAAMAGHLKKVDKDFFLSYLREKKEFRERKLKDGESRGLKDKLVESDKKFYSAHPHLKDYSVILCAQDTYEKLPTIEGFELTERELDLAKEAKPEIAKKPLNEIQIDFDFGESDPNSRVTMIWKRWRDLARQKSAIEAREEQQNIPAPIASTSASQVQEAPEEEEKLFADLDEEETKSTATGTTFHATAELLRSREREEARQLTNMKILQRLKRQQHNGVDTVFYYLKGNITELLTKVRSGTLPSKGATAEQIAKAVADMLPLGFSQAAKMIVGAARYFKNRKHVERMFKISAELGDYIDSNKIIEDFAVRTLPHYFDKFTHYEEKSYAYFSCIVIKELLVQLMVTEGKVSELTGEILYERAKANIIHNVDELSIPALSA